MDSDRAFDEAAAALPKRMGERLAALDKTVKRGVREIRLRVGRPVQLRMADSSLFCDFDPRGRVSGNVQGLERIGRTEMAECFRTICGFSVHTHQNELRCGYVTVKGGHRAGICATAVDSAAGIREVTSVNLRIAREVKGCADELAMTALRERRGIIVAGAPGSGKTTVIRELARKLSSAEGGYINVTLIDERGELAAVCDGVPQNDIGVCCDVLDGYSKGDGIMTAIRTLSPEVIICDEIGGEGEAESISAAMNAGVRLIATAHAGSIDELLARPQIKRLLATGAFGTAVLLGQGREVGRIKYSARLGGSTGAQP